ncbi:hypothetical protein ACUZX0_04920 [Serratia marcescens]|uniref:hypothetical protein n=1 Tax=Serratia marcescens TaxID=615 RepID=UPI0040595372
MLSGIRGIVDERVMIPVITKSSLNEIVLKENNENSVIRDLVISNIPDNSIAFTLDYNSEKEDDRRLFKKLSCYLSSSNGNGINKSCDLVIVTPKNEEDGVYLDILVIDLKSEKVSSRGYAQIENSVLFIDYLLKLCHFYYDEKFKKIVYYKRLITTSAVKNAIGRKGRDQSLTHKVSIRADNKKGSVRYERLIV